MSKKAAKRLFDAVDETKSGVLHRAELVANLAPLLDPAAPPSEFRDAVRDAAFVWGEARPADQSLERDVVDRLLAPKFDAADLFPGDTWYVIARKWLDDWENYTYHAVAAKAALDATYDAARPRDDGARYEVDFTGATLGFTLGLVGRNALKVRNVRRTCPHADALRVDDALTHVDSEALVPPFDEGDFAELLVRLKTARRPLVLAFSRTAATAAPATRPRRGTCDKPPLIQNTGLCVDAQSSAPRLRRDAQLGAAPRVPLCSRGERPLLGTRTPREKFQARTTR